MVQWLRLWTLCGESMGSIPGWGTKIPQAVLSNKWNKILKKFFFPKFLFNTKNILYWGTAENTSRFAARLQCINEHWSWKVKIPNWSWKLVQFIHWINQHSSHLPRPKTSQGSWGPHSWQMRKLGERTVGNAPPLFGCGSGAWSHLWEPVGLPWLGNRSLGQDGWRILWNRYWEEQEGLGPRADWHQQATTAADECIISPAHPRDPRRFLPVLDLNGQTWQGLETGRAVGAWMRPWLNWGKENWFPLLTFCSLIYVEAQKEARKDSTSLQLKRKKQFQSPINNNQSPQLSREAVRYLKRRKAADASSTEGINKGYWGRQRRQLSDILALLTPSWLPPQTLPHLVISTTRHHRHHYLVFMEETEHRWATPAHSTHQRQNWWANSGLPNLS